VNPHFDSLTTTSVRIAIMGTCLEPISMILATVLKGTSESAHTKSNFSTRNENTVFSRSSSVSIVIGSMFSLIAPSENAWTTNACQSPQCVLGSAMKTEKPRLEANEVITTGVSMRKIDARGAELSAGSCILEVQTANRIKMFLGAKAYSIPDALDNDRN
jgi:hypothetical protein